MPLIIKACYHQDETGSRTMNMDMYFIYCRKSSESEDRQVLSIDSQTNELKQLSERLNISNPRIETEARSAKTPGRPIFNSILNEIENKRGQGLIVWHPDRLSRNPEDAGRIISLMDRGLLLEVVTPSQTFRNNPMDKFMLGFFMMNAKLENDNKGVSVERGLKAKAEKGWLPSGAKAGYMNDKYAEKGNKTILPDPERFPMIRQVFDLMLTGTYTVMQIWRILNEELGYRTPVHKRIGGKPMTRSQLYKTLTDPFYYGLFEYPIGSGNWYEGQHKPMITKQEHDRIQVLLGRRGRPRPKAHSFDYTGLMECGECGASITAEEKYQIICSSCKFKFSSVNKNSCPKCKVLIEEMLNPKLLHYVYYHCTKRSNPNCSQGSIRLEDLEMQFDLLLSRIQISENFKNWAISYLGELADKEVENREELRTSVKKQYDECVKSIDNLINLMIRGKTLTDEEFKSQKDSLMTRKAELKERLDVLDSRVDKWVELSEKTFNFASNARYWFEHGSTQEKREILASLGSNLTLKDKIISITLDKPLSFIEEAKKEEPEIFAMLEPNTETDNTLQLEDLWTKNPTMLRD